LAVAALVRSFAVTYLFQRARSDAKQPLILVAGFVGMRSQPSFAYNPALNHAFSRTKASISASDCSL
jgi:hypothetical protein